MEWWKNLKGWQKAAVVVVGLVVLGNLLPGSGDTADDTTAAAATSTTAASEETAATRADATTTTGATTTTTTPRPSFEVGVDEMVTRWNQLAGELGVDLIIARTPTPRELVGNEVAHNYQFSDILDLEMVTLDDEVVQLNLLGGASSDALSNADLLLAWALLIASADPNLPASDRGELVQALLQVEEDGTVDQQVERNGILYKLTGFGGLLNISAEPLP